MVFLTSLWTRKHLEKLTIKNVIYYSFLLISEFNSFNRSVRQKTFLEPEIFTPPDISQSNLTAGCKHNSQLLKHTSADHLPSTTTICAAYQRHCICVKRLLLFTFFPMNLQYTNVLLKSPSILFCTYPIYALTLC